MKSRVLMLGAGFVARPTLDILVEGGVEVTVGKLQIYELWYDHC
jgi:saccharopine dehydrogenase-like NADP-dependent oxidoreductase